MASDGAEVAEDYRLALEDLSSNMRFEISNLTVIARENTEHALAIAEVLQQHILKAPPSKKLPALYVMDSIVKNVGTPYTLYFGRNLFKTFMESYAVVDHGVRRKMEEMLKTWKDPVPGSLDTRPVFSHELVRPIENALMKARAASMPAQQQVQGPIPGRSRPNMFPPPPHRSTPTPPGRGYPGSYPQAVSSNGQQQQMAYHSAPPSHSSTPVPFQSGAGPAPAPGGISVENLSNDIQNLIVALKAEFSQTPHDASVQNRLRALLDLQGVMQHTSLQPDQLELVKNKVAEFAVTLRAPPVPVPVAPHPLHPLHPYSLPPVHVPSHTPTPTLVQSQSQSQTAPVAPAAAPTAVGGGPDAITLESLLGKGAMAALLSMRTAMSQPPPPPPTTTTTTAPAVPPPQFVGNVAIRSPPPVQPEAPAAFSLMEQLRAAGMLPAPTPATTTPAPTPAYGILPQGLASLPGLPASIANFLAAQKNEATPSADTGSQILIDVAALKQQFRPEAISALYDDLGPPCTQCGRRFRTDEEGRRKKTAHMDWHFTVHQRSTEAEKRGTHRSWYVDQQDWQNARESVDAIHDTTAIETAAPASRAPATPPYMPVPEPSSGTNVVCPICQDRFENKWLDTAQEWVWLDAVLVGRKAYHASCHAEATRDREEPGLGGGGQIGGQIGGKMGVGRTPEVVLGKRKAEGGLGSPKIRVQKTFV